MSGYTLEKETDPMGDICFDQAVACVKDYVLPVQIALY